MERRIGAVRRRKRIQGVTGFRVRRWSGLSRNYWSVALVAGSACAPRHLRYLPSYHVDTGRGQRPLLCSVADCCISMGKLKSRISRPHLVVQVMPVMVRGGKLCMSYALLKIQKGFHYCVTKFHSRKAESVDCHTTTISISHSSIRPRRKTFEQNPEYFCGSDILLNCG